jgi:predicted kinase
LGEPGGAVKLILVSGWPGAGKSTIADALARDLGATSRASIG